MAGIKRASLASPKMTHWEWILGLVLFTVLVLWVWHG